MRAFTVVGWAFLAFCAVCPAATIFQLDTHRNGATPFSSEPWIVATFSNTDTRGTVRLTLDNDLANGEFLYSFLFNVTADIDPLSLAFTRKSGPAATISTAQESGGHGNSVKAGWFDVAFSYDSGHFNGPGTSIYDIAAVGLTELTFLALSVDKTTAPKSTGGYYAAADIRGIVNGGSGSIVALAPYSPQAPPTETAEPSSLGVVAGLIAAGFAVVPRFVRKCLARASAAGGHL